MSTPQSSKSGTEQKIRGTREWAVAEINCSRGCPHNCRYCYARYDAVVRRKEIAPDGWTTCLPLKEEKRAGIKLYDGQIMFPASHDIVPENLEEFIGILQRLLELGNRVLVVSKPHLECIRTICSNFSDNRERILFRFTITARDDMILRFWEPGAPAYRERMACLVHAYECGFATSVSVEPMLDTSDVVEMVHELLPFVSHSIWLGKMNKIGDRVMHEKDSDQKEIDRIEDEQSDKVIQRLYQQLRRVEKVRWKESIKEVLGLEPAREAGLDL